jgi:hypothetical protein
LVSIEKELEQKERGLHNSTVPGKVWSVDQYLSSSSARVSEKLLGLSSLEGSNLVPIRQLLLL